MQPPRPQLAEHGFSGLSRGQRSAGRACTNEPVVLSYTSHLAILATSDILPANTHDVAVPVELSGSREKNGLAFYRADVAAAMFSDVVVPRLFTTVRAIDPSTSRRRAALRRCRGLIRCLRCRHNETSRQRRRPNSLARYERTADWHEDYKIGAQVDKGEYELIRICCKEKEFQDIKTKIFGSLIPFPSLFIPFFIRTCATVGKEGDVKKFFNYRESQRGFISLIYELRADISIRLNCTIILLLDQNFTPLDSIRRRKRWRYMSLQFEIILTDPNWINARRIAVLGGLRFREFTKCI